MSKSTLGREGFVSRLSIQSNMKTKAGQEPKAGQDLTAKTEAETTEGCCSLVCTLLAYSVSFLHTPGLLSRDSPA